MDEQTGQYGNKTAIEYEKPFNRKETVDGRSGAVVEVKYLGTDADCHDMIVLGRKQVLRVRSPHFFQKDAD